MSNQIEFSCASDVDQFFREGREYFNDLYVKKLVTNSTYFTRFEEQPWPLNHTTQQKAFRFGRGFHDPCAPFRKIVDNYCATDSCDNDDEVIQRPGTQSYTFELLRKEMRSDWICVESLLYRLFPAEEILQFEESNARITKNVHEEFLRANYIGGAGHKWVGIINNDGIYCGLIDDQAWFVPTLENEDNTNAGYNLCEIRVKIAPADLNKISYLSLDMLDDALIDLQSEDDAFRLDIAEATGMQLLDIVIPDPRVGRALYFQAKRNNGYWDANTDFDARLSSLKLGVNRVIGDYAFGYDINAARFNKNPTQPAGPFSPTDPTTWASLIRVPRYIKETQALDLNPSECDNPYTSCSYVPNKAYQNADFAISVAMVNKAMVKWTMPSSTGYGQAQQMTQNYAGDWEWKNPDWECNRWRKRGFFQAQFRLAAQVKDPTLMHCFLHRLPKSKNLYGSCCELNVYTPPTPITDCYNCDGVGDIQGA
jgi:hypothetical protein